MDCDCGIVSLIEASKQTQFISTDLVYMFSRVEAASSWVVGVVCVGHRFHRYCIFWRGYFGWGGPWGAGWRFQADFYINPRWILKWNLPSAPNTFWPQVEVCSAASPSALRPNACTSSKYQQGLSRTVVHNEARFWLHPFKRFAQI